MASFQATHPDFRNITRDQFVSYFDFSYKELVHPIASSRVCSGRDAIEFFAGLYDLWDTEKQALMPLEFGQLEILYLRHRTQMGHFVDGIKNFNMERELSVRGKTFLDEVTLMQNILWAGYAQLHLMGYVQAQSGTFHCGLMPFENSDVLAKWYGGSLIQDPRKGSLRLVARTAFANIMDFLFHRIRFNKLVRRGYELLKEKSVEGPNGIMHGTTYFEPYMTIVDFARSQMQLHVHPSRYHTFWNNGGLRKNICECLEYSKVDDIVDFKASEGYVAFEHHLYFQDKDKWWEHWDPHKPSNKMANVYIDSELDTRPVRNNLMELAQEPERRASALGVFVSNAKLHRY